MAKRASVTVHPPREREIVIEAGLPQSGGAQTEQPAEITPRTASATASADTQQDAATEKHESPADGSLRAADAKPPKTADQKNDNGYTPTTLDDLKSTPMPRMQKVIILVAILGIVAFIAWYLLRFVIGAV